MRNVTKFMMIALCSVLVSETVLAEGQNPTARTETKQEDASVKKASFEVGMYRVIRSLKMNILVEKKLGDLVFVKLLDQKGRVLFKDVLSRRQQKYGRKFDFSQVPDGHYFVVISNGNEEVVKDIQLSTHKLYEMPARSLVAVN